MSGGHKTYLTTNEKSSKTLLDRYIVHCLDSNPGPLCSSTIDQHLLHSPTFAHVAPKPIYSHSHSHSHSHSQACAALVLQCIVHAPRGCFLPSVKYSPKRAVFKLKQPLAISKLSLTCLVCHCSLTILIHLDLFWTFSRNSFSL